MTRITRTLYENIGAIMTISQLILLGMRNAAEKNLQTKTQHVSYSITPPTQKKIVRFMEQCGKII
jgi:hypothetical protein